MISWRQAVGDEVGVVVDIARDAGTATWSEAAIRSSGASNRAHHVLLAWSKRAAVAYAVLNCLGDEAELLDFGVRFEIQNQGFGRQSLVALINRLQQQGISRIHLEVRESNLAARSLYASSGFKQVGHRADYYPTKGAREDALLMSLDIASATSTMIQSS